MLSLCISFDLPRYQRVRTPSWDSVFSGRSGKRTTHGQSKAPSRRNSASPKKPVSPALLHDWKNMSASTRARVAAQITINPSTFEHLESGDPHYQLAQQRKQLAPSGSPVAGSRVSQRTATHAPESVPVAPRRIKRKQPPSVNEELSTSYQRSAPSNQEPPSTYQQPRSTHRELAAYPSSSKFPGYRMPRKLPASSRQHRHPAVHVQQPAAVITHRMRDDPRRHGMVGPRSNREYPWVMS